MSGDTIPLAVAKRLTKRAGIERIGERLIEVLNTIFDEQLNRLLDIVTTLARHGKKRRLTYPIIRLAFEQLGIHHDGIRAGMGYKPSGKETIKKLQKSKQLFIAHGSFERIVRGKLARDYSEDEFDVAIVGFILPRIYIEDYLIRRLIDAQKIAERGKRKTVVGEDLELAYEMAQGNS